MDMPETTPMPCPDSHTPGAGLALAANQLCELLSNIHPPTLQAEVDENPANYVRLISTLLLLAEWQLKYERHRADTLEAEARRQKELEMKSKPPGITPEVLTKIEQSLMLF
jgi:hypothetical protein